MLKALLLGDFSRRRAWTPWRVAYLLALYGLLPLVLAHAYVQARIGQAVHRLLSPWDGLASVSVGAVGYGFDGRLHASDIVLQPSAAGIDPVRIARAELDTPGLWWSLRALHPGSAARTPTPDAGVDGFSLDLFRRPPRPDGTPDPRLLLPATGALELRLTGLDLGFTGLLPAPLVWFGLHTGAVFEAEGCRAARTWRPDDLRRMGLSPGPSALTWRFQVTGPDEHEEQLLLAHPGVGTVTRTVRARSPDPRVALSQPSDSLVWLEERIRLQDGGLVAARNRHCAEPEDVPGAPVTRHLAAVERLLAAEGLLAEPRLIRTYAAFAARGGALELVAYPSRSQPDGDAGDTRPEARLRRYGGWLRHDNGPPVAFRFRAVPVQPIPSDWTGSVADLLAAGETPSTPAAASPARPGDALLAARPPIFRRLSTPDTDTAELDAAPAGPATGTPDAAIPNDAGTTTIVTSAPSTDAGDAPEPAGSVPEVAPAPAPAPAATTPPRPAGVVGSDALDRLVGETLKLRLADGRVRVGVLEGHSPEALRMRVRLRSGEATVDIPRSNIVEIGTLPR